LLQGECILLENHGSYYQLLAPVPSQYWSKLTADTTLWVRTDGSDSNDGSANNSAHAFATIQAAIDYATSRWLLTGRTITIRLGMAGTYYGSITLSNVPGTFVVLGDTANQDSYVVSFTPNSTIQSVVTCRGANLILQGLQLYNGSTAFNTLQTAYLGNINLTNVSFGGAATTAASDIAIFASSAVQVSGIIRFMRNAASALGVAGGSFTAGSWATYFQMVGNPNYSSAFAIVQQNGIVAITAGYASFSGAATGVRFLGYLNGVFATSGGGATFFPGSTDGGLASGAQYG
jgi:hypothetical protein